MMQTPLLNKLVAERRRKCDTGHIYVDTIQGIAKGYTKANHFPRDYRKRINAGTTEKNISPQKAVRFPSGVFKFLGVDYIG